MASLWQTSERLTGNTAKVQVLHELLQVLEKAPPEGLRILDVGCVGPKGEFDLWAPLLADPDYSARFRLWGVDIQGVEQAQRYAWNRGWHNVELKAASAYQLTEAFPAGFFDVLVSTQVMEHLQHRGQFLKNAHAVLRDSGAVYLTMDSAYFPRAGRGGLAGLRSRAMRTLARLRGAAERYYDRAVYDHEIEPLFAGTGFTVEDRRFYCLHPLKVLHNHKIAARAQNPVLLRWKELEDLLNADTNFIANNKHYFSALYYKLRKGGHQAQQR